VEFFTAQLKKLATIYMYCIHRGVYIGKYPSPPVGIFIKKIPN
jgi:hypothetical protein